MKPLLLSTLVLVVLPMVSWAQYTEVPCDVAKALMGRSCMITIESLYTDPLTSDEEYGVSAMLGKTTHATVEDVVCYDTYLEVHVVLSDGQRGHFPVASLDSLLDAIRVAQPQDLGAISF